jgi:nucleoid-associated protein YgaU
MTAQVPSDRFDDAVRHSTSRTSDGSVSSALLTAAASMGIDAGAELYNEALELAKDGHYSAAKDRLHVLLGLLPGDGEGHLLMAKVHVASQQWRRAIAELDEAGRCGTVVPAELHDAVVRHLQDDVDEDEDERSARLAREQGELKKLRSDTRRLRSENAHVATKARDAELEAKRWMWLATGTSIVAIVFILMRMIGGAAVAPVVAAPETTAEVATPTTTQVAAPAGAVVRDPDQKAKADAALAEAGFPTAKAIVRGTKASLSGTVPTHADRKKAADVIHALGIVETVDVESLVNLAARDGAAYQVANGDTLSKIALRMYGKAGLAEKILAANPELGGKAGALKVGQALKIPPEE